MPDGTDPTPGDAFWSVVHHANFGVPSPGSPAEDITIPLREAVSILREHPDVADATRFRAAQLLAPRPDVLSEANVDSQDLVDLVTPRTMNFFTAGPVALTYTGTEVELASTAPALVAVLAARNWLCLVAPGPSSPPTCEACIVGGVTRITMTTDITVTGGGAQGKVRRAIDPRSWASCSDANNGWRFTVRYSSGGAPIPPDSDFTGTPLGSAWSGRLREVVKVAGFASPYRVDLAIVFTHLVDGARIDYALLPGGAAVGPAGGTVTRDHGHLRVTALQPDRYRFELYKELNFSDIGAGPGKAEGLLPFAACSWFTFAATRWTACLALSASELQSAIQAKYTEFLSSGYS